MTKRPCNKYRWGPCGGMRKWLAVFVFLVLGLCCGRAFAWGSGHLTQARLVLDALPNEIRAFFPAEVQRQIVREYSLYPDRARSFDEALLGGLSAALQPADESILPVSLKYNDLNTGVVARVSITFDNEWKQALGAEPFRFVNNPNLGGWVQPKCELQVGTDASDIRPLAWVTDGTKTLCLAAAWMTDGRARHIFMPEYLLVPCVLSREKRVDFSHPTLDHVGRKLLLSSVRLLMPGTAQDAVF